MKFSMYAQGGALAALLAACPSDAGSSTPSTAGTAIPGTGGTSNPGSTGTSATHGGEESSGGSDASCPLSGDHVVDIVLEPSDFTHEVVAVGPAMEWSLLADPDQTLPTMAPGETLVVALRFTAGPVRMDRGARNLYVTVTASSDGTVRGQGVPDTQTTSTGELQPGPWQPSISTNAAGEPIRIVLGGIHVNPNDGETLHCFSVLATMPAQVNSVEDSSLMTVVSGAPLPITEVRISASGDPPEEPFALSL